MKRRNAKWINEWMDGVIWSPEKHMNKNELKINYGITLLLEQSTSKIEKMTTRNMGVGVSKACNHWQWTISIWFVTARIVTRYIKKKAIIKKTDGGGRFLLPLLLNDSLVRKNNYQIINDVNSHNHENLIYFFRSSFISCQLLFWNPFFSWFCWIFHFIAVIVSLFLLTLCFLTYL